MSLLGDLLKQAALGVVAGLEPADFVGRADELGGQLEHLGVGPDRLSGDNTIVSGAAERVPVHGPEQDRPVGVASLRHRAPK